MNLRANLSSTSSPCIIDGVHVLSFQPFSTPNEDRYLVEDWLLQNGTWKVLAVFDGVYGPVVNLSISPKDLRNRPRRRDGGSGLRSRHTPSRNQIRVKFKTDG